MNTPVPQVIKAGTVVKIFAVPYELTADATALGFTPPEDIPGIKGMGILPGDPVAPPAPPYPPLGPGVEVGSALTRETPG